MNVCHAWHGICETVQKVKSIFYTLSVFLLLLFPATNAMMFNYSSILNAGMAFWTFARGSADLKAFRAESDSCPERSKYYVLSYSPA
jgi:hypothetical protein